MENLLRESGWQQFFPIQILLILSGVAVATFENIRLKINSLRNFCTHTSRILSELFLCLQKVGDVANWYKRLITLHIFLKTLYEYDFDLETIIHISCLIKD